MNTKEKVFYQHSASIVDEHALIGVKTRIWAFAHVLAGAVIGDNCNLCDHTFVEGGVKLGNRVTVKCGVYLWDGIIAEDDVFIGPCVAFTNDLRPRSKQYPAQYSKTILRQGCSLGANSTILPVTIGRYAMVGAGSVITRDVPDFALVFGNPAKFKCWICRCGHKLAANDHKRLECGCGQKYWFNENHIMEDIRNGN